MNRGTVQQPADYGPSPETAMHAVGAPAPGQGRRPGQHHYMSTPSREAPDRLEPLPARGLAQMIMSKDDPAAAGQSRNRLFENRVIPLVGE